MRTSLKQQKSWLLPTVLILFICEVTVFPFAAGMTYAGRSESPGHVLTYSTNKLIWDDAAGISEHGVAELSVFDTEYDNVKSEDGKNVIAPGTERFHIIRLENKESYAITYKAVLYKISDNEKLPVEVSLSGDGFTNTEEAVLMEEADRGEVIRTVSGTLGGKQRQDFDISWIWNYDEGEQQDAMDSYLGNRAANGDADELKVGFYLVVQDENESGKTSIHPQQPKTGDSAVMGGYLALVCISGVLLVLLMIDRRRRNNPECEKY